MRTYSCTFLFTLLLISTGMSSCKKSFLEVDQKQQIVATKLSDYELLMNSKKLYNYLEEGGWPAAVVLGDEVAAESDFLSANGTLQTQRLFHYENVVYNEGQDAYDLQYFLNNIYLCNKVINEVMDATGGTQQQKKSLVAEAKATRAWLYLQIMNLYAKPYAAGSAATDPGLPIIKTADISIRYFLRSTVQEVYDFMITDLNQALPDLPIEKEFPTRMSKPAAEAVLGKTYLFMARFQDAQDHFDAAFNAMTMQAHHATLYNYNETFGAEGSFLPYGDYGPNGPGNNPNDYTEAILSRTFYSGPYQPIGIDGLVLSKATYDLYGKTDWRREFYSATYDQGGETNTSGRVRKYAYTYVKFGVQLPDLYLMRAECRARLNNLSGAMEDLMMLRNNRIPVKDAAVPDAVRGNQAALLHYIIEERIREFAAEGYRWFDMRRLHNDPLFTSPLPEHVEYNNDGTETTYPLREERLTLRLPPVYISANPGITNNP